MSTTCKRKPFPWSSRLRLGYAAPVVLALFLVVPSLVFIFVDQRVWPWDQAWYGEVAVDLWWTLLNRPGLWPSAMLNAFGTKPPVIAWIGQFFVPLGQALGSVEIGLLLLQCTGAITSLVLIFHAGRSVSYGSVGSGVFSMIICGAAPLFIGMATQFFPEMFQLAVVAGVWCLAVGGKDLPPKVTFSWLLLLGGAGLITKATTPLYTIAPTILGIMNVCRVSNEEAQVKHVKSNASGCLYACSAVVSLVCIAWYANNYHGVLHHMAISSSGEVALNYGQEPVFGQKAAFWTSAFLASFFADWPAKTIFAAMVIFASCGIIRRQSPPQVLMLNRKYYIFSLGQIALVVLVLGGQINEETRFLLPLLPSVAILVALGFSAVSNRNVKILLFALATVAYLSTISITVGYREPNSSFSAWLKAPSADSQHKNSIQAAVSATSKAYTNEKLQIIGYELPWFNANSFSFYSAKNRMISNVKALYTSLGYAEKSELRAWKRFEEVAPIFFITLQKTETGSADYLNAVSQSISERIKRDERFQPMRVDNSSEIRIYGRSISQ